MHAYTKHTPGIIKDKMLTGYMVYARVPAVATTLFFVVYCCQSGVV